MMPNSVIGLMADQQRKSMGMQQMSHLMQPAAPPLLSVTPPTREPGQQSPATGGLGTGGYQGAASALGPPVTHGKLGNGPGVNMLAGGQTAGGIKVAALPVNDNTLSRVKSILQQYEQYAAMQREAFQKSLRDYQRSQTWLQNPKFWGGMAIGAGIPLAGYGAYKMMTPEKKKQKIATYPGCGRRHMQPGKVKSKHKSKKRRSKMAEAAASLFVKQSFILPFGGIGAVGGALTSPRGKRMEGAGRGAAIGAGTGLGTSLGMGGGLVTGGYLGGLLAPLLISSSLPPEVQQELFHKLMATSGVAGALGGGLLGGTAGNRLTRAMLGRPSWEQDELMTQQ